MMLFIQENASSQKKTLMGVNQILNDTEDYFGKL